SAWSGQRNRRETVSRRQERTSGWMRPLTRRTLLIAVRSLADADPALAASIERFGPPPLWAREPSFATLTHLILEQQVSLASARAAFDRLEVALAGGIEPGAFLELAGTGLRGGGFGPP